MCRSCDVERAMTEVKRAQHRPDTKWFWTELRVIGELWDVLRHPFYERWSSGALSRGELQVYAEEYDHAVVGLAVASLAAARKSTGLLQEALRAHASEEAAHVDLWREFAEGTGWCRGEAWRYGMDPYPETVGCARSLAGDRKRSLALDLVTLYVFEAARPEIARTKLKGLLEHYSFREGSATEYFRLHAQLDGHHAELAQSALEGLLPAEDPFALLTQAEGVHRAYWNMLDRLEREEL